MTHYAHCFVVEKYNAILNDLCWCEDVTIKPSPIEHKPVAILPIVDEIGPFAMVDNASTPVGKVDEMLDNTKSKLEEEDSSDPKWLRPPRKMTHKSTDKVVEDSTSDEDGDSDHHSASILMRTRAMPIVTTTTAQPIAPSPTAIVARPSIQPTTMPPSALLEKGKEKLSR